MSLAPTLGSVFLIDAVFGGWRIGVALRAVSIALVFATLGLATGLLTWWPNWRRAREFAPECTRGALVKVMAVCAVVIGVILIASVVHEHSTAWYFQPWFQLAVAAFISVVLAVTAHRRTLSHGGDFGAHFRTPPPQ